jgi:succinate dehydrogenase / fumarate reductase flavoprotein subunit
MAEIKNIVDRVIETDILVVGGGGAGANAAVAAARSKTKVMLVAKGALGRRGERISVW